MTDWFGSGFSKFCCLIALTVAPSAKALPPPVEQYSADCAAPTYASDQLVCGDPQLLQLDGQMVAALAKAGADAIEPSSHLIEAQANWLKRRSLCAMKAGHSECLVAAYGERIAVLRNLDGGAIQDGKRYGCSGSLFPKSTTLVAKPDGSFLAIQNGRPLAVVVPVVKGTNWVPFHSATKSGVSIIVKSSTRSTAKCKPAA